MQRLAFGVSQEVNGERERPASQRGSIGGEHVLFGDVHRAPPAVGGGDFEPALVRYDGDREAADIGDLERCHRVVEGLLDGLSAYAGAAAASKLAARASGAAPALTARVDPIVDGLHSFSRDTSPPQ